MRVNIPIAKRLVPIAFLFIAPLMGCEQIVDGYFLHSGEQLEEIFYAGNNLDKYSLNNSVIIYTTPEQRLDQPLLKKHAFIILRDGLVPRRYDLNDSVWNKEVGKFFCGSNSEFIFPEHARITQLSPESPPYLIIYGPSSGSAGYSEISIYSLFNVRERKYLCDEGELTKAIWTWVDNQDEQPKKNRWLYPESLDDILYVISQVRGN